MPAQRHRASIALALCTVAALGCQADSPSSSGGAPTSTVVPVGSGYAGTGVNAVIFRRNSLVSDGERQFISWYDERGRVMVASRTLDESRWRTNDTGFVGDVIDAHNSISLMIDGAGFLHLAWDHHNDPLHYARSDQPHALTFTAAEPMLGTNEDSVTYPEFHPLPDGDLLFAYRDGSSGRGNLVLNRYDPDSGTWTRVQSNLLDGEQSRNAYWQLAVDNAGTVHLSWVWRETPDASSNHLIAYARSLDGGKTWQRIDGTPQRVPITLAGSDAALLVPQNSNLINQTTMAIDAGGRPYIATYYRDATDSANTQIRVVHHTGSAWRVSTVTQRSSDFELAGAGTRSLPISRPLLLTDTHPTRPDVHVVYRDEEADDRVVLASSRLSDEGQLGAWQRHTVSDAPTGRWEPSHDSARWRSAGELDLFLQSVQQASGDEGAGGVSSPVQVLEIRFPRSGSTR